MIRFSCVNCSAVLRVGDDKAGKVAVCPQCKAKMQIPDAADQPVEEPVEENFEIVQPSKSADKRIQSSAPPASRQQKLDDAPPVDEEPLDDESSPTDEDDDERQPRRKRRRRRRRGSSSGSSSSAFEMFLNPFTIGLAVGLGLWTILLALHLVGVPVAGVLAIGVGLIVAAAGRIWFLSIAFSEDSTVGYMVLWVPFYEWYYLISNFAETWKPYLLNFIGGTLAAIAFCAGGMRSFFEDELGPQQGPGNFRNQPNLPPIPPDEGDDEDDIGPGPGMPGRPGGGPGMPRRPGGEPGIPPAPRFPNRAPAPRNLHGRHQPEMSRQNAWNASATRTASRSIDRQAAVQASSRCLTDFG